MDEFFDDFDEGEFVDGNDFEDKFDENCEPENCFEDDQDVPDEPDGAESQDNGFSAKEAFMLGVALGWGYEEGLEESERRKLEKKLRSERNGKEDSEI